MKPVSTLLVLALVAVVGASGCVGYSGDINFQEQGDVVQPDGTVLKPDGTMVGPDGEIIEEPRGADELSEGKAVYKNYDQASFDQARAEGKVTLLYFWAVWCPICQAEDPKVNSVVSGFGAENFAAFRVNYDTQTDLNRKYQVPYQHTTIILDGNGNEAFRSLQPLGEAALRAEIEKVVAYG